jgi:uncharacterized membrane protein YtjA (UPF0391 family)
MGSMPRVESASPRILAHSRYPSLSGASLARRLRNHMRVLREVDFRAILSTSAFLKRDALGFEQKGLQMLHYALVFFVVALIAAVFGFGGIAAGAAEIAKILFFIFLILFVVSLVTGLFRRGQ